jgi:UDP-2,4-diacetamido-2,4,6-trideoxy-beta-L-altropyranose hydrolase
MIGIRADANRIIATGHVMRCITIAKEIVKQGESVTFFVADEESRELVNLYAKGVTGIETVVLGSNWQDMEKEIPALVRELKERNVSALLVDSYQVTCSYFEELKDICPIAYMDDLGKEPYPVDILINYSGYYESMNYKVLYKGQSGYRKAPTELLLGLSFAPLREQFYEKPDIGQEESDDFNILVTSGGTDNYRMLSGVIKAMEEQDLISKANFKVVAGNMVSGIDILEDYAGRYKNVEVLKNVEQMADLMRSCNLAIAAAGTMLTECAAVGLPVIYYQVADNQKFNVSFWQGTGGMSFAGDVTKEGAREEALQNICAKVKTLLTDKEKLSAMKNALSGVTDGCGAVRIAKALLTKTK